MVSSIRGARVEQTIDNKADNRQLRADKIGQFNSDPPQTTDNKEQTKLVSSIGSTLVKR